MHMAMVVTKEKTGQPRLAKIFPAKYMVTNNSPNINPAKILRYTVVAIFRESTKIQYCFSFTNAVQ